MSEDARSGTGTDATGAAVEDCPGASATLATSPAAPSPARWRRSHELASRACVVIPPDLAEALSKVLHAHFAPDPFVDVVVDRRFRASRVPPDGVPASVHPESYLERRSARRLSGHLSLPAAAEPHRPQLDFWFLPTAMRASPEDPETHALVRRFQAGDATAFEQLYMENFGPVCGYLQAALGDSHEAQDLAQQVFVNAYEALGRFELRTEAPVRAWFYAIARNQLRNTFERRRNIEVRPTDQVVDDDSPAPGRGELWAVDWLGDSPAGSAFAALSDAQRRALTLRFVVGLNAPETAAVMGRTAVAVRQLQSRAFAVMEERLRAMGCAPREREGQRTWMLMRIRRLPVLRARRFALWSGPIGQVVGRG